MFAIQTVVGITFLNAIYDEQTTASLECRSTHWTSLYLGKKILFTQTTKVKFIYN